MNTREAKKLMAEIEASLPEGTKLKLEKDPAGGFVIMRCEPGAGYYEVLTWPEDVERRNGKFFAYGEQVR